MNKFVLFLLVLFCLCSHYLQANLADHRNIYKNELTNRFILLSDKKVDQVAQIPIKKSWWSRPHEYAWAAQFAHANAVVLDAACGISHPFKWYLGQTCKKAWACDSDVRILSKEALIQETYDDLGTLAKEVLICHPHFYSQVSLAQESICAIPDYMPKFDRIFCISTLEHLNDLDRRNAMISFAKFLAPDGLLVLTVDYPEVSPQTLIALADSVGLVPVGDVELNPPSKGILTNGYLSIYRCVFAHKEN